jgi:hypothetical protein
MKYYLKYAGFLLIAIFPLLSDNSYATSMVNSQTPALCGEGAARFNCYFKQVIYDKRNSQYIAIETVIRMESQRTPSIN